MRVLQINCVYGKGSTGRIVDNLHQYYLSHGMESYVVFGRGGTSDDQKNVIRVSSEFASKVRSGVSRMTGNLYGMATFPSMHLQKILRQIQPNVVHLHCINGNFCNVYRLIEWLKKSGMPTVITQHAEFFYTGNCGYAYECEQWKKSGCGYCPAPFRAIGSINVLAPRRNWQRMRDAFDGFECLQLVGVSDWISERSNQSAILGQYKCETVMNGQNTDVFRFLGRTGSTLHEVLYVTPYFEESNKGGEWFLKLAESTAGIPIHYTVAGRTENSYSLDNVTFVGVVTNQEKLAELYSNADACVLTSKQESFSMVVAEALCCGTPVVGFRAGGPERICIQDACSFVPYGDVPALRNAMLDMLSRDMDRKALSEQAREKYSVETMARHYIDIYGRMTRDCNGED